MTREAGLDVGWDDLRLCLAVVRARTASGAARALGLSHSTVIRRIAELEQRIGVTLFTRLSSGYEPNEAGQLLAQAALDVEPAIVRALANVVGGDRAMRGVIRLAVPDLSGQALMRVLAGFAQAHPGVTLQVEASQTPEPLTRGEAHLALTLTAEPPTGQVGVPVGPVAFAAYAARKACAAGQDLAWLALPAGLGHIPVAPFDRAHARAFARVHRLSGVALHHAGVRAGLGAGVLACAVGDADADLVRVGPVLSDPAATLWILHRQELRGNARVATLFRALRTALLPLRSVIGGSGPDSAAMLLPALSGLSVCGR